MKGLRIRWKAIVPAVGVVVGVATSPQVLATLPDKWSHTILALSALAAIFTPAVATNRPPSTPE
jgi:hypothetical protein